MADSTSSNVQAMKQARERIINLSYKFGESGDGKLVDIVRDYPWILDNVNGNNVYMQGDYSGNLAGANGTGGRSGFQGNHYTNVPVCYMVERKSVVNAAVANILNILSTLNDIGQTMQEGAARTGGVVSGVLDAGAEGISSFKKMINGLLPSDTKTLLGKNNLNEEVLNPYRYLYITAETGKKYVFPITSNEAASFMPTKLAWGDFKGGMPKMLKSVFDIAQNVLTTVAGGANIIRNFASLGSENGDDNNTVSEMPKAFTYPKSGDSMQIQFTLYNTTRKNAWKNNFRFLYLFAVRNMPFRTETLSFVPPLLYDIIIPGIKRMPVSALSEMKVVPKGMIRVLQCENFLDGGSRKIQVNVPEAWEVTLKFQSLIAPSANLMLSNMIGTIGITAFADATASLKLTDAEYDIEKEKLAENEKKIKEMCENLKKSAQFDKALSQMKQAKAGGYASRVRDHIGNYIKIKREGTTSDSWAVALKGDPFMQSVKKEMGLGDAEFDAYLKNNLGLASPKDYFNQNGYFKDSAFNGTGSARVGNSKGQSYPSVNSDTAAGFESMVNACDAALRDGNYSDDTKQLWSNSVNSCIQNGYYANGTDGFSGLKGSNGTPYNPDYVNGSDTPSYYISPEDRAKTERELKALEDERKNLEEAREGGGQYTPLCDGIASNSTPEQTT